MDKITPANEFEQDAIMTSRTRKTYNDIIELCKCRDALLDKIPWAKTNDDKWFVAERISEIHQEIKRLRDL